MKLFNLFKRNKSEYLTDGHILFYHEDDYCQVELSPKENSRLYERESEKVDQMANTSFDGSGYTDIYVRQDNGVKLAERRINPIELQNIIAGSRLQKAAKVTTGYGQTFREHRNNTIGYGKNYTAIYFDFNKDVVTRIWITGHFNIGQDNMVDCLFQLGQKWNLILMDWNQTVLVDLTNRDEIEKYLTL